MEVFTPAGNWSSYPPHKHDVHNPPGEVDLEEIYYYRIQRPEGYAIQKLYTPDRRVDEALTVRTRRVGIERGRSIVERVLPTKGVQQRESGNHLLLVADLQSVVAEWNSLSASVMSPLLKVG